MAQKSDTVFLSYANSDRGLVDKIRHELNKAGWKVWDSEHNLLPGSD